MAQVNRNELAPSTGGREWVNFAADDQGFEGAGAERDFDSQLFSGIDKGEVIQQETYVDLSGSVEFPGEFYPQLEVTEGLIIWDEGSHGGFDLSFPRVQFDQQPYQAFNEDVGSGMFPVITGPSDTQIELHIDPRGNSLVPQGIQSFPLAGENSQVNEWETPSFDRMENWQMRKYGNEDISELHHERSLISYPPAFMEKHFPPPPPTISNLSWGIINDPSAASYTSITPTALIKQTPFPVQETTFPHSFRKPDPSPQPKKTFPPTNIFALTRDRRRLLAPIEKGNNSYGRKGKPRCLQCRKRKGAVLPFPPHSTPPFRPLAQIATIP